MRFVSPISGQPLEADTPHSLAAPGERWPMVDGIPYLRIESEGLVAVALDHLDAGCHDDALVGLLTDQDAWWTGPATDLRELKRLVRERDTLTLREAMALLRFGPVADYFAYRWSDPTYLAGLALLEAHWSEPKTAFELACGIGHYLRELTRRGVACVGADVVFAKCWLAKHWVAPDAEYVVFDAASRHWPVQDNFDLVQCHDAFYFMPQQEQVARRLREHVAEGGVLAVSHVHSADYDGDQLGPAVPVSELARLFPDALAYDELGLLLNLLSDLPPAWTPLVPHGEPNCDVEVFSLVVGGARPARRLTGGLALPLESAVLRRNPLLSDAPEMAHMTWPSDRYRSEYARHCYWAVPDAQLLPSIKRDSARLRRVVDLPERW